MYGREMHSSSQWHWRLTVRLARGRTIGTGETALVPLAIVAFVLFLLLLGAIGLVISMGVLAFFGKVWRVVMRR